MINIFTYEVCDNENSRELVFSGIDLPHTADFDPLAKIWSSLRKRCKESYHVDIIATFFYDDVKHKVLVKFYLNYCECDVSIKTYRKRFRRNYPAIVARFANVVMLFMSNVKNGYADYYSLWEKGEGIQEYNKCLNLFLETAGLRTENDKNRAAEKNARFTEALKSTKKTFQGL